jgi:hypothetical protein
MPSLNWIGKDAVVKHHKDVPFRLLEPVRALSCGADAGTNACSASGNLIVQGHIREDVTFAQLAEFVWFSEIGTGYTGTAASPLLGMHNGRAIYLLYNGILKDKTVASGNVLSAAVFDILPPFDGPKTIYSAACRLGAPVCSGSRLHSSKHRMRWRCRLTIFQPTL